jgi:hypothetical protein
MIAAFTYLRLFPGLFWKSGVVLGAALCLSRLLRKKSADLRRVVLSTSVAALLLAMAAAPILPFRIRAGSVEHTVINGQQALHAIGEYQQLGQPIIELLVWVYTEHARAYLLLRAGPSEIEALQPAFEQLIQSARIP